MERLVELGTLLAWYGAFLTPRQQTLVRQYTDEDCSLSEIAEREGVSRQAVRDAITRAEKELSDMEDKLHLVAKAAKADRILTELEERTQDPFLTERFRRLRKIVEDDDGV